MPRKKSRPYSTNKEISFHKINNDFAIELLEYCQANGLKNSTITHYFNLLKIFLSWSADKSYCTPEAKKALAIDLKTAKNKVIALTFQEIKAIAGLDVSGSLEAAKDCFVFQCLTGLRYSDLQNLKATDRKGFYLDVSTIKTGEFVTIELNETTAGIWGKYKEFQAATGKAFPVQALSYYISKIKKLGQMAGIVEPITHVHFTGNRRIETTKPKYEFIASHTARRSFISNGLNSGISSEVLRQWTGHTNDQSFQKYYEISPERKRLDMDKFNL